MSQRVARNTALETLTNHLSQHDSLKVDLNTLNMLALLVVFVVILVSIHDIEGRLHLAAHVV